MGFYLIKRNSRSNFWWSTVCSCIPKKIMLFKYNVKHGFIHQRERHFGVLLCFGFLFPRRESYSEIVNGLLQEMNVWWRGVNVTILITSSTNRIICMFSFLNKYKQNKRREISWNVCFIWLSSQRKVRDWLVSFQKMSLGYFLSLYFFLNNTFNIVLSSSVFPSKKFTYYVYFVYLWIIKYGWSSTGNKTKSRLLQRVTT